MKEAKGSVNERLDCLGMRAKVRQESGLVGGWVAKGRAIEHLEDVEMGRRTNYVTN